MGMTDYNGRRAMFRPVRTAQQVSSRAAARIRMRRFASHCDRHYHGDPRYNLDNVVNGFVPCGDSANGDTLLLERICKAYAGAVAQPHGAASGYEATDWWANVRRSSLRPAIRALQESDLGSLRQMYANFFRDPCSAGLIGRFGDRRAFLGDALYRLDYWLSETGGRFALADLAGPEIGNPLGVLLEGTLVRSGCEYQHYCAHRMLDLLNLQPAKVAEIGGGYGGMAYYLLRDGGRITYIDFDVPESTAMASYYLLKAFPESRFRLFGESLTEADVALLPVSEMARMPAGSVDLTFSSHLMADLSDAALAAYLGLIGRMTRSYFLYLGDSRAAERISKWGGGSLTLLEARSSGWNRHIASKAREGEYLYRVGQP